MARKLWVFEVEGKRHEVYLEDGFLGRKRRIIVDRVPFKGKGRLYDRGSLYSFDIAGANCALCLKNKPLGFDYELYVNGEKIEPK